jgi:hypothetical protein
MEKVGTLLYKGYHFPQYFVKEGGKLTEHRTVWIAYVPLRCILPLTSGKGVGLVPGLRVVASASWGEERIRKAICRKFSCIGPTVILRKLHADLVKTAGWLCRVGYASVGESLSKAWEEKISSYSFRMLHLPSWGMEIFPAKKREDFRKVRHFPAQPQAEILVRYYRKRYYRKGLHVIRVYIKNVQRHVLQQNSHIFFSVMRDFIPMGCECKVFDKGYEIAFAPISEVEAIRVLRKLVKIVAKRLIKKGFISYRCASRNWKPLPKGYLRFLSQKELQILQSLRD